MNVATAASTPLAQDRMQSVLARVMQHCDLPPLPAVSAQALSLLRDPSANAEDMARLIGTDGSLAARVVKLSRSAMYLRRTAPVTLRDAILTVGFAGLRQILLAASVRSIFKIEKAAATRLWEHGLVTALAAEELRKRDNDRHSDSFLVGLLHDVGRQLFFIANPGAAHELPDDDMAAEQAVFGITHVDAGTALAQRWGLDDDAALAILGHHDDEPVGPALRLANADRIANALGHRISATGNRGVDLSSLSPDLADCAARVAELFAEQRALFD